MQLTRLSADGGADAARGPCGSGGTGGGGDGSAMAAVLVTNWPCGEGQAALLDVFRDFALHPNGLQLGMQGPDRLTNQVRSPGHLGGFANFRTRRVLSGSVADGVHMADD